MSLGLLVDLGCDDPSHCSWSFREEDTRSNRSRAREAQRTEVRSNKGFNFKDGFYITVLKKLDLISKMPPLIFYIDF